MARGSQRQSPTAGGGATVVVSGVCSEVTMMMLKMRKKGNFDIKIIKGLIRL